LISLLYFFCDKKQTKIKAKVYPELVVGKSPPASAQMIIFLKVGFYEADAFNWQYCKYKLLSQHETLANST